ncbi:hypothetical protein PR048_003714 [Dryococelus australis]|uniref:Fringe-like glycosyltransferase domain-containing protein n=1 Tax=Dryococelus australis TaxID=614101 RepID=A0ABQ9INX7_9NEOP|nr:hypothetical protein PR048_003714 [Dryococelus australis]
MAARGRRRSCHSLLLGVLSGLLFGALLARLLLRLPPPTCPAAPAPPQPLPPPPPPATRQLLLVGVMTAQKYLHTRAVAVRDTWGREIPGRVLFFSSWGTTAPAGLPLVALPAVDDSYPPQKKSFLMLKYMWERYGDRFEWFMRADDDVYVRPDKLARLLRSVDSRKPHFIGQAGRGNQEEFGLLSLEYDENFCMGGPGMIMSRETLARVAPHIRHCLKNLYTTHEDVELGRCVHRFAGIPCTWSYEPARLPPRLTGSVPDRVTPGYSHMGIVPDDAAGRRVFSGISRSPRPFVPAPLHTSVIFIGSQDLDVKSLSCLSGAWPHLAARSNTAQIKRIHAPYSQHRLTSSCPVAPSWFETRSEIGSKIDRENCCTIRVQNWTEDLEIEAKFISNR